MSNRHVIEALLRPAVELYSVATGLAAGTVCLIAPWSVMLAPSVSYPLAGGFLLFAGIRARQGMTILRYRRNIRRLPRYVMTSSQVPVSRHSLFIGLGFRWEQKHTQRLHSCRRPEVAHYIHPGWFYRQARSLEKASENRLPLMRRILSRDSWLNPVRPLPPAGGSALLHGIELNETDVTLPLGERVGHTLVMGTTRVGKTRLAEIFIIQDIRRGEVVIIFDPKGDADLLKRVYAEAKRAGRENEFYVFHLGWPDISARYNAVGRFGRISEVASRIAGQLSGEGNSAAFKEFAWRFVNIISRALIELGQRPDYLQIIARQSNLVVIATGTSLDDLELSLLLGRELVHKGIPHNRLYYVVGKAPSQAEGRSAIQTIYAWQFACATSFIMFKPGYSIALDAGYSITETP